MISSNGSKYFLLLFALFTICFVSCQNQPKLKSFNNVITADDSLNIELSKADILTYHSDKLGLDITYPSYLRHQFLEDEQMEVFLNDDLSLSFMEQRLYKGDDIFRTPGQQLMGMGLNSSRLAMTTAFIRDRMVISNTTPKSLMTPRVLLPSFCVTFPTVLMLLRD